MTIATTTGDSSPPGSSSVASSASEALVLVAGMIPAPGEKPADWWDDTGYRQAVEEQARRDGGLTGNDDPFIAFYHDVPRALAEEALSKERSESETVYDSPWPLAAWPAVPTRFVLCTEDRFFPPASCAGSWPSDSVSRPTRSPRVTAWRSAARGRWPTCSPASLALEPRVEASRRQRSYQNQSGNLRTAEMRSRDRSR